MRRFQPGQDKLRPCDFRPCFAPARANGFILTEAGKGSMSISDVTFEELLAMLRRSPELVVKKWPLYISTVITLTTPIFVSSRRRM
jgi:hypothetical protein